MNFYKGEGFCVYSWLSLFFFFFFSYFTQCIQISRDYVYKYLPQDRPPNFFSIFSSFLFFSSFFFVLEGSEGLLFCEIFLEKKEFSAERKEYSLTKAFFFFFFSPYQFRPRQKQEQHSNNFLSFNMSYLKLFYMSSPRFLNLG